MAINRGMGRDRSSTVPITKVSENVESKNRILKPLVVTAAISVATFSSIGVAAITGHLQIASSNFNPFAGNQTTAQSIDLVAVQVTHQGLTRHAGQVVPDGKPLDFRPGKRVPSRKVECDSCGVIDSIQARTAQEDYFHNSAPGLTHVSLQEGPTVADGSFVVTVRMGDGSMRTILENQRPAFSIGERVQLVNGTVIPLG